MKQFLYAGLVALLAGCAEPLPVDSVTADLAVCAAGPTVNGVDVSHYDGVIDWKAAHAGGIDFAIMKASEGLTLVDDQFATNWANAGANGVIRGAYHFFRPEDDPVQQADFFIQVAGMPQWGDLPLAIDLEATDNLTAAQVAAGALAFLQRVQEKTGRTPIIYTSSRVFDSLLGTPAGFESYLLWDANWQVPCPNIPDPPWTRWTLWQNSATGTIPGIGDAVDLDAFNGSLADLTAFVSPPPADAGPIHGDADPLVPGSDAGPAAADDGASGCAVGGSGRAPWLLVLFAVALWLPRRK